MKFQVCTANQGRKETVWVTQRFGIWRDRHSFHHSIQQTFSMAKYVERSTITTYATFFSNFSWATTSSYRKVVSRNRKLHGFWYIYSLIYLVQQHLSWRVYAERSSCLRALRTLVTCIWLWNSWCEVHKIEECLRVSRGKFWCRHMITRWKWYNFHLRNYVN